MLFIPRFKGKNNQISTFFRKPGNHLDFVCLHWIWDVGDWLRKSLPTNHRVPLIGLLENLKFTCGSEQGVGPGSDSPAENQWKLAFWMWSGIKILIPVGTSKDSGPIAFKFIIFPLVGMHWGRNLNPKSELGNLKSHYKKGNFSVFGCKLWSLSRGMQRYEIYYSTLDQGGTRQGSLPKLYGRMYKTPLTFLVSCSSSWHLDFPRELFLQIVLFHFDWLCGLYRKSRFPQDHPLRSHVGLGVDPAM